MTTVTDAEVETWAPGPFRSMTADDPRLPEPIKAIVRTMADQAAEPT